MQTKKVIRWVALTFGMNMTDEQLSQILLHAFLLISSPNPHRPLHLSSNRS